MGTEARLGNNTVSTVDGTRWTLLYDPERGRGIMIILMMNMISESLVFGWVRWWWGAKWLLVLVVVRWL